VTIIIMASVAFAFAKVNGKRRDDTGHYYSLSSLPIEEHDWTWGMFSRDSTTHAHTSKVQRNCIQFTFSIAICIGNISMSDHQISPFFLSAIVMPPNHAALEKLELWKCDEITDSWCDGLTARKSGKSGHHALVYYDIPKIKNNLA